MKKVFSLLFVLILGFALVACTEDEVVSEKMYTTVTALADGFTSLENTHANPPLVDGVYTVGDVEFNVADVYNTYYLSEVTEEKFNYLTANSQWNSKFYTNMVDGLVENDQYGAIVGALAVGYKVVENANGTQTYTFQIKEGVQWVDNTTGLPYAEVVADDFVAGLEYVLNPVNASQTATIVTGFIYGAEDYFDALADDEVDDLAFSTVGVEAVSKYQVAYTIAEPAPYFLSALTYSPFLPVNRQYLTEVGTAFGVTENYILANGAFRITKHTFENTFEMTKNNYYWDFDHVYVNKVSLRYLPNAATPSTLREWYEAGLIDNFTVSQNDTVGWETYVQGGANGTGTARMPANTETNGVLTIGDVVYAGVWNFDRDNYLYSGATNFDESGAAVPPKTAAQEVAAREAILNVNFRLGFTYGLDFLSRMGYSPEPSLLLMRAYTNRELTAYDGRDYSDYVDEAYNEAQGTTGISLSGSIQGGDAVFDVDRAVDFLETAKTELIAGGLTAADFPILIDVVASRNATTQGYEKALYAPLLAEVGPDSSNPIIDVRFMVASSDAIRSEWNWEDFNFDLSFGGGWGPDYADPKTYLGTICIGGDFTDNFGLTAITGGRNDQAGKDAIAEEVFGPFDDLYRDAIAITDPTMIDQRYEAMAAAEYAAIFTYGLTIPWQTTTSIAPVVSKAIPKQAGTAAYGLTSDKYKNVIISETPMTQATRAAVVAAFEAAR